MFKSGLNKSQPSSGMRKMVADHSLLSGIDEGPISRSNSARDVREEPNKTFKLPTINLSRRGSRNSSKETLSKEFDDLSLVVNPPPPKKEAPSNRSRSKDRTRALNYVNHEGEELTAGTDILVKSGDIYLVREKSTTNLRRPKSADNLLRLKKQ